MYKGNIAFFFLNAKKFVSLMFHKGAFVKDSSGLLEGEGKKSRVARFNSIEGKKAALESLIKEWIRMRDSG